VSLSDTSASPSCSTAKLSISGEKGLNRISEYAPARADWSSRDHGAKSRMKHSFLEHFKCPEQYVRLGLTGPLSASQGFFSFGPDNVGYGRLCQPNEPPNGRLHDVLHEVKFDQGEVLLPFDVDEVVENLRCELYPSSARNEKSIAQPFWRPCITAFVPVLSVEVRKYLQRLHLRGWDRISFPHWPVDRSVDDLFELLMLFTLQSQKAERIPFIWFWPEGAPSSAIMTHDVETTLGRDFCGTLMDIDDAYGVKASFQVVPERRYEVTPAFLDSIAKRGFE
jgi:hypothetical protein